MFVLRFLLLLLFLLPLPNLTLLLRFLSLQFLQLPYLSSASPPRAPRLDPRVAQFRHTCTNQSELRNQRALFEFELRFEAIDALFRSVAVIVGAFRRNSEIVVRVFGFLFSFRCHG